MDELTSERIDEIDRDLAAEERYTESTGARTTSYRWLQRCRQLLALAREHAALRQRLGDENIKAKEGTYILVSSRLTTILENPPRIQSR